jgi:rod shape determining protein RodA
MGFAGSIVVIGFVTLFLRVIYLAKDKKLSLVAFMDTALWYFIHTLFCKHCNGYWNLPNNRGTITFFSYGGSGLWGFTILLFIFLRWMLTK